MSLRSLFLAILAAFSPSAYAVDGHGVATVPCSDAAATAMVTAAPGTATKGSYAACLTSEFAKAPVSATLVDGGETTKFTALDNVFGSAIAGRVGFGRVGIGASLPVWFASLDGKGDSQGVQVGDARVYVPIGILRAQTLGALGLDTVFEVLLPTGSPEALLGAGGPGAGAHLVLGGTGKTLAGAIDFGLGYTFAESLAGQDNRLWSRLALAGSWRPVDRLSLGLEGWFMASPLSGASFAAASPGEVLASAGVRVVPDFSVTVAGGTAFTPGVGAAEARAYLRLQYAHVNELVPPPPVVESVATVASPFDVYVSVRDETGKALVATVHVEGPAAPPDVETVNGDAKTTLSPGSFTLRVSADGYASQTRTLVLAPDAFVSERIDVVLHPSTGTADLTLSVRDSEGRRIGGAFISVDGESQGVTGSGGDLTLSGVAAGKHTVAVSQPDFRPHGTVSIEAPQALGADNVITLERPPGSVRVVTRGRSGPIMDARVRFSGPEDVGPSDLGRDGERTFTLLPGDWVVVVSAASFGAQEREVHVEAGSTSLVEVDVRLADDEGGNSQIRVRAVDLDGNPVDGAMVSVDGQELGRTSNGGTFAVSGLRAGPRSIVATGERFRPGAPVQVSLGEGVREVELPLAYLPGQLRLRVHGIEGGPVDARVRLAGPSQRPAENIGPDGEAWWSLELGEWAMGVSSPSYGLQEREFAVAADDGRPVDILVALLSEDGTSNLTVLVRDDLGEPVNGAGVLLDGKPVGTTAGGSLQLYGLRNGKHDLVVSGEGFERVARDVNLGGGGSALTTVLKRSARPVILRALGPQGAVTDAFLRVYGGEQLPAAKADSRGERALALAPGEYTFVAVSELLGIGQKDETVVAGPGTQSVDIVLAAPEPGKATLLVEVVDPAGGPVAAATLSVAGKPQKLGANGIAVLENIEPGALALAVEAPGYIARGTEKSSIEAGVQVRRLRLEWLPRPVEVRFTDATGKRTDAEVRAIGPGRPVPVKSSGGVASLKLLPGSWQIIASAAGYGPFLRDVVVGAGADPFVVDAKLSAERVEVTQTSVVIREKISFAFDKADITPDSYPVLDQVAAALLLHPEIVKIEVQGHTDDKGKPEYNLDLSQRRAEAVKAWLVAHGVESARIVARGYGDTRPIGKNESESGRAANRRVQFEVVKQP